jgi:hypothetical protein
MSTTEFKQLLANTCNLCDKDAALVLLNYAVHYYIHNDLEHAAIALKRMDQSIDLTFKKSNYKKQLFNEIERQASIYN